MAYASTVRSLLCTGDFHKYPVLLCWENSRLLKVLDALSIRLYEFPMEVLKLVQLRYLSLVYEGNLPTSISKLLNLQYLIVGIHSNVIFTGNLSYLPIEIWNMNELKNVDTTGRDLPHPCEGSLLPNLLKLAGVSPETCTKDVFEKIPNLEILMIVIDLDPDATKPLRCFDHISHLHKLEEIKCSIRNPSLKTSKTGCYPTCSSTHLTLQCHAFRDPKWEVHDDEFQKLTHLMIEDTDLVQWKFVTTGTCLPAITFLRIGHCYKLKEIALMFGLSLKQIRIIECNPMVVDCAIKIWNEYDKIYDDEQQLVLNVISSL